MGSRVSNSFATIFILTAQNLRAVNTGLIQIIDLVCCLPLPSAESTLMPPLIRKTSTSSQIKFVASSQIANDNETPNYKFILILAH